MRYSLLGRFLNKVSVLNANNWMNVIVTDVPFFADSGVNSWEINLKSARTLIKFKVLSFIKKVP